MVVSGRFICSAPRVCIEEKVLSFGNVPCGQSVTSLLHVSNNSDVTALFQVSIYMYMCIYNDWCGYLPIYIYMYM